MQTPNNITGPTITTSFNPSLVYNPSITNSSTNNPFITYNASFNNNEISNNCPISTSQNQTPPPHIAVNMEEQTGALEQPSIIVKDGITYKVKTSFCRNKS